MHIEFERSAGGLFGDGAAVLLGQCEDAEDATDAGGPALTVDAVADAGDLRAGPLGGGEPPQGLRWGTDRPVSLFDAMRAPRRPHVLVRNPASPSTRRTTPSTCRSTTLNCTTAGTPCARFLEQA